MKLMIEFSDNKGSPHHSTASVEAEKRVLMERVRQAEAARERLREGLLGYISSMREHPEVRRVLEYARVAIEVTAEGSQTSISGTNGVTGEPQALIAAIIDANTSMETASDDSQSAFVHILDHARTTLVQIAKQLSSANAREAIETKELIVNLGYAARERLTELMRLHDAEPTKPRRVIDNPLTFYSKHYSGLTATQLRRADRSLHEILRAKGLLSLLPTDKGKPRHIDDPLKYYREHYPHLTRGPLDEEDPSLYEKLRASGELVHVPLSTTRHGDDPLAYYQEHCAGMSRGDLIMRDPQLYARLRSEGLLKHIPLLPNASRPRQGKRKSKYGDDPLAYYRAHYSGMTRGELGMRDAGLYSHLAKTGLLIHVPLKKDG